MAWITRITGNLEGEGKGLPDEGVYLSHCKNCSQRDLVWGEEYFSGKFAKVLMR